MLQVNNLFIIYSQWGFFFYCWYFYSPGGIMILSRYIWKWIQKSSSGPLWLISPPFFPSSFRFCKKIQIIFIPQIRPKSFQLICFIVFWYFRGFKISKRVKTLLMSARFWATSFWSLILKKSSQIPLVATCGCHWYTIFYKVIRTVRLVTLLASFAVFVKFVFHVLYPHFAFITIRKKNP